MEGMLLGIKVDVVSLDEAAARVEEFIGDGGFHQVVTLNPEMVYLAQHESQLKDIINSADLVTPDGIGVVWAARLAGIPLSERVAGIDLMSRLVGKASEQGIKVFFLGASPGVAQLAANKLRAKYPGLRIAGVRHGYFEPEEEPVIVEEVKKSRPHLLFVGLGSPKQEYFIARHLKEMEVPVAMGVGGSFDVLAGKVARSPRWMQKCNLEWLGRLLREPWRLPRMMLLPRFALLAWKTYRWKQFYRID